MKTRADQQRLVLADKERWEKKGQPIKVGRAGVSFTAFAELEKPQISTTRPVVK